MADLKNVGVKGSQRDRVAKMLIWACFIMHLLVQGSKNAYTAEVVTLQGVFGKNKAEVSLAMTLYFITYAVAQIILSMLMGKINLKVFMSVTIGLSGILTVLIAFMPNIYFIYVLCSINGVLQAGSYSGCMAVVSKHVPMHLIPFANTVMSSANAIAGFISYGVPAYFVGIGRWDLPFIILGAMLFFAVCFFFYMVNKMRAFPAIELMDKHVAIVEQSYVQLSKKQAKIVFLTIMMLVAFVGNVLHYATMNWVPDMLHSVFAMPQEYSILITLLMPLAMFLGSVIAIRICEKFKNLFFVGCIFSGVVAVILLPITLFYEVNMVLTLVMFATLFMISSGQRLVYGSILAFKMSSEINVGSYIAATNAAASIAAGVAPTVAGSIIDAGQGISGYGTLYLYILILAVVLLLGLLLIFAYYSKKKVNKIA